MFSQFSDFVKNLNEKSLFAFIKRKQPFSDKSLCLFLVNIETEKVVAEISFPIKVIQNFIDELQLDNKIFKAIIVDIFDIEAKDIPYGSRWDFRNALKEKLNELQIPNFFIRSSDAINSTSLIAANINIPINETILIVTNSSEKINVTELKCTTHGYEIIRNQNLGLQTSREAILGTSNPQKIILLKNEKHNIALKKILKSRKLIVFSADVITKNLDNFIVETCKWILDKKCAKYHIIPKYRQNINVCCFYGLINKLKCEEKDFFLHFNAADMQIPCKKFIMFSRSFFGCAVILIEDNDVKGLVPKIDRNCHRSLFTLSIDEDTVENFTCHSVGINRINFLPKELNIISGPKPPVIGFFDNYSVILIYNKFIAGYEFLKSWNDACGKDLFISFDRKKQKYFEDARKMMEEKQTFVVFDLLKTMSLEPENISTPNAWGFTITKDSENPILLEFDTFDGTKKAASPQFLMAVLLRKHLKAIEEEICKKPKEIALWFYNELNEKEQFNGDEMNRIKEGLKESCKLLEICCSFVDC